MFRVILLVFLSLFIAGCTSKSIDYSANPAADAATTSQSQDFATAGTTKAAAHSFLQDLQQSVASGNKREVAELMHFPLRINRNGHTSLIMSQGAFIRQYERVITPHVRQVILHQQPKDLFVNSQGVMLGSGEVWVHPEDSSIESLKIIVFNL